MSKRFIDTDLIRKSWYRRLTPSQKALWIYLVNACDVAGVIECDLEAMSFAINAKITMKDVEALGNQVELFDGDKLHVVDFVSFQFGQLSPACKPHIPIIKLLSKYDFTRVSKGYTKGIQTLEEKEKEMDKEEDKEKEGGCKGESDFDLFWSAYPRKKSKGDAVKAFDKAIKITSLPVILDAITRLSKSSDWLKDGGKYIPYPASWLNAQGWEDESKLPFTDNTDVRGNQLHPDAIRAKERFASGPMIGDGVVDELFDTKETA